MCVIADIRDLFGGVERAAGHVVSIFQADESRLRIVINFGPNDGFDLRPIENSIFAASDSRHAACNCRHGSEFVEIDMAALFANHLIAMMRPDFDGDEIAHAAGRNKKSGLFAEDFGSARFQSINSGILEINVVANFGFGHGAAHCGRGACHGVAAQIDNIGMRLR